MNRMTIKKQIIAVVSNSIFSNVFKLFKTGTTVISYHGIIEKIEDPIIQGLHVEVKEFRSQLEHLKNNYRVISANTLYESIVNKKTLGTKDVVITFDDGYKNVLDVAAPILKKFDFPFTVFVNTAYVEGDQRIPTYYLRLAAYHLKEPALRLKSIGKTFPLTTNEERLESAGQLTRILKGSAQETVDEIVEEIVSSFSPDDLKHLNERYSSERLLNWEQMRLLKDLGATIGSHCHRHTILNDVQKDSTVVKELCKSKELIEKNVDKCKFFAYPNGSQACISSFAYKKVAEQYSLGFTTEAGEINRKSDLAIMPRIWAGPTKSQTAFSLFLTFRKNKRYTRFVETLRGKH